MRVVEARSADAAGDETPVLSPRLAVKEVCSACFGERVPTLWASGRHVRVVVALLRPRKGRAAVLLVAHAVAPVNDGGEWYRRITQCGV